MKIPANRVVAATSALADVAAAVTAVVGVLPNDWKAYAVVIAADLTKTAAALKFLEGSQNIDRVKAQLGIVDPELLPAAPKPPVEVEPAPTWDELVVPESFEAALENVQTDYSPHAAGVPSGPEEASA